MMGIWIGQCDEEPLIQDLYHCQGLSVGKQTLTVG